MKVDNNITSEKSVYYEFKYNTGPQLPPFLLYTFHISYLSKMVALVTYNLAAPDGNRMHSSTGPLHTHEGVTKSFRTGRLERELKMVQLSVTRYSCIAIL